MSETCWFCEARPADPSAGYTVYLHAVVQKTRTRKTIRTTWRSTSVEVPRCEECRSWHRKVSVLSYGAAALLFLIPFVGFALAGWRLSPLLAVGLALGAVAPLAGVLVWGRRMRQQGVGKGVHEAQRTYPGVQALTERGWTVGKKPRDVN